VPDSSKRDFSAEALTWDNVPARVELARAVAGEALSRIPVRTDMDALDYGAGTGLVTLALAPHVHSIAAADSAPGMLDRLREKIALGSLANVRALLLDLETEASPEQDFDLIVSSMTLHHITDAKEMIRTLSGMLRGGGYLAIADLDLDGGLFHPDPTGVRHNGFDRGDIAEMLTQAGLTDVVVDTAHTVTRPVEGESLHDFPVFLATGRKP
jgi:2-polyprenyl-3-methyl-5-hydroxy-6-metoxy-1,4-benzoquinol methylase